ncbi:Mth938-like domain-containing protein [Polycladidibacter hongkongensis]|uniref:Mth938-like domain-containing protein n=1 Tax=Polycladidibacter hongkongensis TaxID=1647556 RepID=UPI00082F0710|nr:MTH938/NDUFAF3 family protein [Pseudovibrio hongkongensis]
MASRGEKMVRLDAHFPQQVQIDAYGDGGFRFADMSHRGSLLCLPSGIYGWGPTQFDDIADDDLVPVLREAAQIEVLLIGAGDRLLPFAEARKAPFREQGIMVDSMSTGAALRTYNVLLNEDRAVACALIAVE